VRSERAIRRCVRCAAESRCAAAARSGIIGLTIRDSSCCHRMAAGIRQVCGRLSAARSCVCSAAKCVRSRRRGCDAFVLFTHSAWVWRVWPGAIRWLGSDLRSGQRREYSPNMPAPEVRRERPPLVFGKLGGHCSRSVSSHFRRLSCAPPSRRRVPSLLHTVTALAATTGVCSLASVDGSMGTASGNGTADIGGRLLSGPEGPEPALGTTLGRLSK
jgi:hypothetical protein